MEKTKYQESLEQSAERITRALDIMFKAADADEERLREYFARYGDLYYRPPNTDTPTDMPMLPLLASQATKLKSLLETLEAIHEKLYGKKSKDDGGLKGEVDAAEEDSGTDLASMGFKV